VREDVKIKLQGRGGGDESNQLLNLLITKKYKICVGSICNWVLFSNKKKERVKKYIFTPLTKQLVVNAYLT